MTQDKDENVEKRRDEALLRALTTPPAPRKPASAENSDSKKKTAKPAKRA